MNWFITNYLSILVLLCGIFYSVLCVFSIVTGIIYMLGKRKLNPLELSEKFVQKLEENHSVDSFAKKMGLVTFVVGIVQGITAFAFFFGHSPIWYWIALGFTIFSIGSVCVKLKGKINFFPLLKFIFYVLILIVLLLNGTRNLFFEKNNHTKLEEISMVVVIEGVHYEVELEDNSTVQEFLSLLPLKVSMKELNGNEKYVYLDTSFSTKSSVPEHIDVGDIMLYGDNCVVLFYQSFDTNYRYTKIGHIYDLPDLGKEDIVVQFQKK